MPLTEQRAAHAYEVGEEVIVRLEAGGIFEVVEGEMALHALPDWTIAEIVSRVASSGAPQYMMTFAWAGSTYKCTVAESAIEGTA